MADDLTPLELYLSGLTARQAFLDEKGAEILDSTPMAPPVGYKRTPSLAEQIRQMVKNERFAQSLEEQGVETPEEADDFNIGDDYDPSSPWEHNFDPAPPPQPKESPEAMRVRHAKELEAHTPPSGPQPAPAPSPAPAPAPEH